MENLYTLKKSLVSLQKRLDGIHIDSFNSSLLDDMLPIIYDFKELIVNSPLLWQEYICRVKEYKKYIETLEYENDKKILSAFLKNNSDKNHFIPFILTKKEFIPHEYFSSISIPSEDCNYETEEDFLNNTTMFNENTISIFSKVTLDEFYRYILSDVFKKTEGKQQIENTADEQEINIIKNKYIKKTEDKESEDKFSMVNEYMISDVKLLELLIYNPPQKMMLKMAFNGCLQHLDSFIRRQIISLFSDNEEETNKIDSEYKKRQEEKKKELIDEYNNELKNKKIDFCRYTELKSFNDTQKDIINEIVNGKNPTEISKILHMPYQTVNNNIRQISKILHETGLKKGKKGGYKVIFTFFDTHRKFFMTLKK